MKKKLLACLTASSMLLSMFVASGLVSATTGELGSDYKITKDGDVRYVSNRIFNVTFPTAQGFKFVVDPQGLYGTSGSGNKLSDLAVDAGKIIFEEAPTVLNESGVPITLTAAIQVTGGATHLATTKFTTANTPQTVGAMANGTGTIALPLTKFDEDDLFDGADILDMLTNGGTSVANEICMFMSPSKVSVSDDGVMYESSGLGYILGSTASTFKFVLDAAEYVYNAYDDKLELVSGTGNGTKLQLGGYVNTNADWTNFTLPSIIIRPATLASVNLTRHPSHAYTAATVGDLADYKSYALNKMDASVTNHFSIDKDIDLSDLVVVTDVTNTSSPTNVALGAVNDSTSSSSDAISANVPYKSLNPAYAGGIVRGAAITAANNNSTALANQVATHRAWGLNATAATWDDVIWLPVAVTNPAVLEETEMVNASARTIGISVTFKFTESTTAEKGFMNKHFGWNSGGITAALDGIVSREVSTDTYENIAYGLLGSSVNTMKVIAVDFKPKTGFLARSSEATVSELTAAGGVHFVEFMSTEDGVLPTGDHTKYSLKKEGTSTELITAATNLQASTVAITNSVPAVATTAIYLSQAQVATGPSTTGLGAIAYPDIPTSIPADDPPIINRIAVALANTAGLVTAGDKFILTVTVGSNTYTHTINVK